MSLEQTKIAFIGSGNMAEALVSGLLKSQLVASSQMMATDSNPERLNYFRDHFHVSGSLKNPEAFEFGDVVFLAVKPQVIHEVFRDFPSVVKPGQILVSVVAGLSIGKILSHIGLSMPVVRSMPNTPSIVLEGATAIAGGPDVLPEQMEMVKTIFQTVGRVEIVPEEMMNAVTGLSGGGPAYVCLVIEALADGGVKMGLPRATAQTLAAQTVLGAAKMILESDLHPGMLKDRVASPGGTTIAGLQALEEGGLRASLMKAVERATQRSEELA